MSGERLIKTSQFAPSEESNPEVGYLKFPEILNSEDKIITSFENLEEFKSPTIETSELLDISNSINNSSQQETPYDIAIRTKDLFSKHRMVRQVEGFFVCVNLLLSHICFEYIIFDAAYSSSAMKAVSITVTVFQLTIVALHITGVRLAKQLAITRKCFENNERKFQVSEYFRQGLVVLLLSIHPFILSFNVPVKFISETFYISKALSITFHRNLVDYLILGHFIVNYFTLIHISIENSVYLSNQYYRIAGMFGTKANIAQCLKSIMNSQQIFFSAIAIILGVFFFTVVFRITESFFINQSNIIDPENLRLTDSFSYFFVCFWFSVNTMTTVGFGDFVVGSQLSRFFIYFAGLYGVLNNSMAVVAFMNFFSMNNQEDTCFTLIERIDYAEDKARYAARSIEYSWLARRAEMAEEVQKFKTYTFKMHENLSKFTDYRNRHANTLSANSRYEYLTFAAEKLLVKSELIHDTVHRRIPKGMEQAAYTTKNKRKVSPKNDSIY